MNKQYFERIFLKAVQELRKKAPKDTGNLAYNAIKYRWIGDNEFEIYIDVGDTDAFVKSQKYLQGTAPYTPFTNEKWISPRWNGKQNPNENWWNNAVEFIIAYIANATGGDLEFARDWKNIYKRQD